MKWLGYNWQDNTWEPMEYLNCEDRIDDFEKKNGERILSKFGLYTLLF